MADLLTFDAAKHVYRYDGRVVPSVTQILDPLQELDGVPRAILEAAREFGSHVHLACHLLNIGKLDLDTLDEALVPYVADWQSCLTQTGMTVIESETRLYNRHLGYAGTPDSIVEWQRTSWVVDLKSGVVPWTVGAQLAAYQHARPIRPRRRLCVQLTGNGYKLHEQKDLADFNLFLSALNIYKAREKRKPANAIEYA